MELCVVTRSYSELLKHVIRGAVRFSNRYTLQCKLYFLGAAFREMSSKHVYDFQALMEEGKLPRLRGELFIEKYRAV